MDQLGWFDPELIAQQWFDPEVTPVAWFDEDLTETDGGTDPEPEQKYTRVFFHRRRRAA